MTTGEERRRWKKPFGAWTRDRGNSDGGESARRGVGAAGDRTPLRLTRVCLAVSLTYCPRRLRDQKLFLLVGGPDGDAHELVGDGTGGEDDVGGVGGLDGRGEGDAFLGEGA